MSILIKDIVLVDNLIERKCSVFVKDGKIVGIFTEGDESICADEVIEGKGKYLSHGFIDIHCHGGGGHDFMDGTIESYFGIAKIHSMHGTTALLPTSVASSKEDILKTSDIFSEAKHYTHTLKFLGLHLEGPYVNPEQAGALDKKYIRNPDKKEYSLIIKECPDILRWTVAPELEGAMEMGDYLKERGIVASIGHSNATYEVVKQASVHGFTHITHLYSAMSTIVRKKGFRYAGIVESAYLLDNLTVEIIADGRHLPNSLIEMVYRFIGPKRTAIITDAMRGAGMPEGESVLGSLKNGIKVIIEDNVAKLPDREAFAGSVATSDRLVRTMTQAGVPLSEAVYMVTKTPADIIGKNIINGSVCKGNDADLVMFDKDINIYMTMVNGRVVYEEGSNT